MVDLIKTYLITLLIFFTIDIIWLVLIAKKIYQKELGYLMAAKPNWLAALIFYLVFISGLVFFVINPALEKDSWSYAVVVGIYFGFITYATYDLTNLATLKDWPLKITIIDLIWGSTLGGVVSTLSFFVLRFVK